MDKQIQKIIPDYKLIYSDILTKRYPGKKERCENILSKDFITILDVIRLENIIFNQLRKEDVIFNQKLKSYDTETIREILDYQEKFKLTNTQLALHFKLSRNTVSKWKKRFAVKF